MKVKKGKQDLAFYTMPQYEEWKEQNNGGRGWDSKYLKVSTLCCLDGGGDLTVE